MARNRIIYQSEALYAGPSPATGVQFGSAGSGSYTVNQLFRIQNVGYSYSIPRKDVNQFGELAAIDRVILESPTVSIDFGYLNFSLLNEKNLGFTVSSGIGSNVSCISGFLNKTTDERNYFVKTVTEGSDANGTVTNDVTNTFIGIGNGFVTSYQAQGAVGDFAKASVSVESLNINFSKSSGSGIALGATLSGINAGCVIPNPAVIPVDGTKVVGAVVIPPAASSANSVTVGAHAVSALRPGDITFDFREAGTLTDFADGGIDINDAKIQSYNLSFNLSRDPLQKLGSKFAFSREIQFPVTVSFSVQANVGDLVTGNLADFITVDKSFDLAVKIKHPVSGTNFLRYDLRGAKLDGESFAASIGANKSVTLNFSAQIGGPTQTGVGLFMSGVMV